MIIFTSRPKSYLSPLQVGLSVDTHRTYTNYQVANICVRNQSQQQAISVVGFSPSGRDFKVRYQRRIVALKIDDNHIKAERYFVLLKRGPDADIIVGQKR